MNKSHRIRARIALAAAAAAIVLILAGAGWRFLVYPAQQEEIIRTELSTIGQFEPKDEQILNTVEKFAAEHPYGRMTSGQKQAVRDEMENAMRKCFAAGKSEDANQIRDILINHYGEEEAWKAVHSYAEAGADLDKDRFEEGLGALYERNEEGALDAQKHWEAGVTQTLEAAREYLDDFKQNRSREKITLITNAYRALEKYGAGHEEEFEAACREFLAKAAEDREAEQWGNAKLIYKAMQEAGAGDSDELSELMKETDYEQAEAAFAKKDYNTAASTYKGLGDYKDAAEKANESVYLKAVREAENGSYSAAVKSFKSIPGYKDADERVLETQKTYCEETAEEPTDDTYEYIQELVDAGYEGAEELRDEIYEWHASISTGMAYSFGSMQSAFIRAKLSGGPPDATTTVTFRIDDPAGNDSDTWSDGKEYKSGDTAEVNYSEEDSSYNLFDRSYKIWVYADGGVLIGTYEGKISTEF